MRHLLAAVVLLAASPASAFPAHVVSCHDGDTCRVETGQGVIKIRLAEIDAPEIDQPYGTAARDALCAMICGKRQRRAARHKLRPRRRAGQGRGAGH
jgi:endonuclease YncB( thermonuclease family)